MSNKETEHYWIKAVALNGDEWFCDNHLCELYKTKYFVELEKRIWSVIKSGKTRGISRADDFVR